MNMLHAIVTRPAFLAFLLPHGAEGGRLVVASRGRQTLSTFDWSKGEGLLASRQALAAPTSAAVHISEDARTAAAGTIGHRGRVCHTQSQRRARSSGSRSRGSGDGVASFHAGRGDGRRH
eukprot:g29384.t1